MKKKLCLSLRHLPLHRILNSIEKKRHSSCPNYIATYFSKLLLFIIIDMLKSNYILLPKYSDCHYL